MRSEIIFLALLACFTNDTIKIAYAQQASLTRSERDASPSPTPSNESADAFRLKAAPRPAYINALQLLGNMLDWNYSNDPKECKALGIMDFDKYVVNIGPIREGILDLNRPAEFFGSSQRDIFFREVLKYVELIETKSLYQEGNRDDCRFELRLAYTNETNKNAQTVPAASWRFTRQQFNKLKNSSSAAQDFLSSASDMTYYPEFKSWIANERQHSGDRKSDDLLSDAASAPAQSETLFDDVRRKRAVEVHQEVSSAETAACNLHDWTPITRCVWEYHTENDPMPTGAPNPHHWNDELAAEGKAFVARHSDVQWDHTDWDALVLSDSKNFEASERAELEYHNSTDDSRSSEANRTSQPTQDFRKVAATMMTNAIRREF